MNLQWSETARGNLASIREYVSAHSETAAQALTERIINRCEQISEFPLSGHVVAELNYPQIRQVIVDKYRIIYHLGPDSTTVIAIVHSAQNWPGPDMVSRHENP